MCRRLLHGVLCAFAITMGLGAALLASTPMPLNSRLGTFIGGQGSPPRMGLCINTDPKNNPCTEYGPNTQGDCSVYFFNKCRTDFTQAYTGTSCEPILDGTGQQSTPCPQAGPVIC